MDVFLINNSMKTLNNIRNILFCGIVLGAFASFAQNEYGIYIMIISGILIGLIFFAEAIISCVKNWKSGVLRALYLLSENLCIGIIFMCFFYINYSSSESSVNTLLIMLMALAILFLFIQYIAYAIRILIKDFRKAKILSIIIFFFFIACLFTIMSGGDNDNSTKLLDYITIISGIIFLLLIILKIKFPYKGQTITLKDRIMKLQGKPAMLVVYFGIWSIYFRLVSFNLSPPIYTLSSPPALEQMKKEGKHDATISKRAKTYSDNYTYFLYKRGLEGNSK
jgi:hypothetical protein